MKLKIIFQILIAVTLFTSCKKDFLDKKPNSNIVVPKTLTELQALLENQSVMNRTSGLAQVSCDDYVIENFENYQSVSDQVSRNAYIWNKELYAGQVNIQDWNSLYKAVFYANNILKELDNNVYADQKAKNQIKGWALFCRSYAFYNLINNFGPVYNSQTAATDLGIPLRLEPGIDYIEKRATQKEGYDRIIADLKEAITFLSPTVDPSHPNRPTVPAGYALLARIYLYMGDYKDAEDAANRTLEMYHKLIDFNTLDLATSAPIGPVNEETLFYSIGVDSYQDLTYIFSGIKKYTINRDIISSYASTDLRRSIYFRQNPDFSYVNKTRFTYTLTPFSGLTTSEVFLIKAECQARRNELTGAMITLDQLLASRFQQGSYENTTVATKEAALAIILKERRKELVWRGLRWSDIKRLNREQQNIILTRVLNEVVYTLPPNDPRYTFPIPDDEILKSGIVQNLR